MSDSSGWTGCANPSGSRQQRSIYRVQGGQGTGGPKDIHLCLVVTTAASRRDAGAHAAGVGSVRSLEQPGRRTGGMRIVCQTGP